MRLMNGLDCLRAEDSNLLDHQPGESMGISEILTEIDRQIERLKQARTLLDDGDRRATGKAVAEVMDKPVKKKRNLSP
jgi:hypothetical protein